MLDAYIIERIRQNQHRNPDSASIPLRIRIPEKPPARDPPGGSDEATPPSRGIIEVDQNVEVGIALAPRG